jgi:hypothetical protein
VWLVGTPVLLPTLLLVFLERNLLPLLTAAGFDFSRNFPLLSVLLFSCCALGLFAFPCWTLIVTTQDFVKFWVKIFAFVLHEMIEISQEFKTF